MLPIITSLLVGFWVFLIFYDIWEVVKFGVGKLHALFYVRPLVHGLFAGVIFYYPCTAGVQCQHRSIDPKAFRYSIRYELTSSATDFRVISQA